MRKLLLCPLLLVLAAPAAAGELAGVSMEDSVQLEAQDLVLNGMGLRTKLAFKVYVAGLYLPSPADDAEQILAADTPRRTVLHFVRKVGAGKLCGGWSDCLEANTPEATDEIRSSFDSLCDWMEDVVPDDQVVFTYLPGDGTEVEVKGQSKGRLEGKGFADALFACWIGAQPPSESFKEGLLGGR